MNLLEWIAFAGVAFGIYKLYYAVQQNYLKPPKTLNQLSDNFINKYSDLLDTDEDENANKCNSSFTLSE